MAAWQLSILADFVARYVWKTSSSADNIGDEFMSKAFDLIVQRANLTLASVTRARCMKEQNVMEDPWHEPS